LLSSPTANSQSSDINDRNKTHSLLSSTFSRGFTLNEMKWLNPDELFTQATIEEYVRNAEKGTEGDVPFSAGFARKYAFWKMMFFAGILGIVMGFAALGFMTFVDNVQTLNTIYCGFRFL
jgi:hypothetical protein